MTGGATSVCRCSAQFGSARTDSGGKEAEEEAETDVQVETESLFMNKVTVAHGDHLHAGKSEASALQSVEEVERGASVEIYYFIISIQ